MCVRVCVCACKSRHLVLIFNTPNRWSYSARSGQSLSHTLLKMLCKPWKKGVQAVCKCGNDCFKHYCIPILDSDLFLKTMSVNDLLVLFTRSANSQHFWKDLFCWLTYLPSSYPRRDFNNMADIRRRLSLNEQWKFQRLVYLHERMAI